MTSCPRCEKTYSDGADGVAVRFCPACGSAVEPHDPYIGRLLMGQFRITGIAGRGAMGTVYTAEQTTMGRVVAVKILREDLRAEEVVLRRFLREARAAARLSHPSIVTVHLVGETDEGVPYIVMEFIDGTSLGALCEREGPLETRRAVAIAQQIASALAEAHGQGIVHRDLKPENILIVDRGRLLDQVKVLDFGIAKIVQRDANDTSMVTRDGMVFGTPHYISPEQAAGEDVDARADIYSFGVLLFRMLVGQLPFEGNSGMQVILRHLREEPPRPRSIRPEIPPALEELILWTLKKDRSERIQDAEQLLHELDQIAAGLDGAVDDSAARTLHGVVPVRVRGDGSKPRRATDGHGGVSGSMAAAGTNEARADEVDPAAATAPEPAAGEDDRGTGANDDPGATQQVLDELHAGGRSRARYLAAGAIGVGAIVGLLIATTTPGSTRVASPDLGTPADMATPRPRPPLHEERVVEQGGVAMRVGFTTPPTRGEATRLRIELRDGRGAALTAARVEVALRFAGATRDEEQPALFDGVSAHFVELTPRSAGPCRLSITAATRGAEKPLHLSFDFGVLGGASVPARAPRLRPRGEADEADGELPNVVIPPATPSGPPTGPRALGPPPTESGEATPPPPAAATPAPPHAHAAPPSRSPSPAVAPSETPAPTSAEPPAEADPYQVLERR